MQAWHTRTAHCLHEEEGLAKTPTPMRLSFGRVRPGWLNLAGKVKNSFLVTIDEYRPENRKIEVCRVSGC